MAKRRYILKKRAARQQETRERIVDAAMALHEELGPAATTISALAERAGVQRLTVYRHFPNERDILGACTSKWLDLHPPPDATSMTGENALERTRAMLLAFYRYYRRTEKMWSSAYRDLEKVPDLAGPMAGFERHLTTICHTLLEDWAPGDSRELRATLSHALRFSTWQSLARERLSSQAMADLVCSWANAAAG